MRTVHGRRALRAHAAGGMEIVLKKNLGAIKEREENPA
jgi:hypothetical protein